MTNIRVRRCTNPESKCWSCRDPSVFLLDASDMSDMTKCMALCARCAEDIRAQIPQLKVGSDAHIDALKAAGYDVSAGNQKPASATGWICPICHAGVAPSCVRCPCRQEKLDLEPIDFDALKAAMRRNPTSPHVERKVDPFGPGRMNPNQYSEGFGQAGTFRNPTSPRDELKCP